METKHTPGPWRYEPCGSYRFRDGSFEPEFVITTADSSLPNIAQVCARKGQTEANAKLLAVAPKLLDALQMVSRWLPRNPAHHDEQRICAVVRDAITEATR